MVNCAFLIQNPKSCSISGRKKIAMHGHMVAPFRNSEFKMTDNIIKRFVY